MAAAGFKKSDRRPPSSGKKRKPTGGGEGSSSGGGGKSDQTSSNKKRALKHERQSHRRHADVVTASKETWNKLRLKTNSKEETVTLTEELHELLRGKYAEVALKHDASRVVQAAVQFGNAAQRAEIVRELGEGDTLPELAKVQYGHFVVLKVIRYCFNDEACVKIVTRKLKGQMSKLAVHSVGARVVELLFATFQPRSTALLWLELYGPQFALFSSGEFSNATSHPTLSKLLEGQPDKRSIALEHVLRTVQKGVEKALFGFAYFQKLMFEYATEAVPLHVQQLAPSVADHIIHLLSTRPGSLAAAEIAAVATAKDRKRMARSLKGYARSSLLHRDAYIALLRLLDVTDDTKLTKGILAELQVNSDDKGEGGRDGETTATTSPILDLALSETGSKLFLLLLSDEETRSRYFDPSELRILRSGIVVKVGGEEVPTSKKNPRVRREELLQFLKGLLSELCLGHTEELLRSMSGSKVLREVCREMPSSKLSTRIAEIAFDSVGNAEAEGGDVDMENEQKGEKDARMLSIFEDQVGHIVMKHLLVDEIAASSCGDDSERVAHLAIALQSKFKGALMKIASSNRGAFVLSTLAKVETVKVEVLAEIEERKSEIADLSKGGGEAGKGKGGYEALLNVTKGVGK